MPGWWPQATTRYPSDCSIGRSVDQLSTMTTFCGAAGFGGTNGEVTVW